MQGRADGFLYLTYLICSHNGTTISIYNIFIEGVIFMSISDTYVRARIDTNTKERACEALEAMGLSISDVIRLLMLRIAEEKRLPFKIRVPNSSTRKAIEELEEGKGKRFKSIRSFMEDLNEDD
ncbi:MAG: dinJ [Gammaproteobacteria bacterium]|jgi:DNA-damage-inducible protein J|nr:dinJ [Gammaproteobacteria bacterium]